VGTISDNDTADDQVDENAANGTAVGITAFADDPDAGDTVTYSLDDDAGGRFAIDSSTGVVTVADGTLLDFETGSSHNTTVRATSTDASFSTKAFTINILDANDAPVITTASLNVAENQTNAGTIVATDADGDTPEFSITGGADGALFAINSTTGELTFNTAPDFEAPTDANLDNVYEVEVTGDDGNGGTTVQSISVTVTDLPEDNLVNQFLPNQQTRSDIATDAVGNYVVVWQSELQDGNGWEVYARRFDAAGAAIGPEVRVNQTLANDQTDPRVAVDAAGNFVITWARQGQDGDSAGETNIYARVYDSTGTAVTGEFLVNQTTLNNQATPAVAMDGPTGEFMIAWAGFDPVGGDWNIFARRYDVTGAALDGEIVVNTTMAGDQIDPDVGVDVFGEFGVVWTGFGQDGDLATEGNIYVQNYRAGGPARGGEVLVNTTTAGHQHSAAIAKEADGDYDIVWVSEGQDGDGAGIFADNIAFGGSGANNLGEYQVNATTTGDQINPDVSTEPHGNVVFTWQSFGQDGDGPAEANVYARLFEVTNSTITPFANEFLINITVAGDQMLPAVSADGEDDFVVAWSGNGFGDADGVFSRVFENMLANTAPEIELANPAVNYAENDPPLVIDSSLTVSDPDDTNLAGATVNFRDGFAAGQDVLSYTPVAGISGTYDAVNGVLTLTGTALIADYTAVLRSVSYENTSDNPDTTSRVIEFRVDDGVSSSSDIRKVNISASNDPPTFTSTATPSVPEGTTAVQTVTANDPEADALTFSITGGDDQAQFSINSTTGELTFNTSPDFESPTDADTNNVYEVEVTADDGNGGVDTQTISVTVTDGNDAPLLDNSGASTLTAIDEDETNNLGDLVADIIASGAGGDPITDIDAGAVEGIAVIGADDANGTWQYSTNGGGSWTSFGAVSEASAVVLGDTANDRIRFVPDADFNGTALFTFRAWDRTDGNISGTAGVDTSSSGGSSPFSTATETATINVAAVNDDPSNAGGLPADVVADEDVTTNIDLSLIDLEDVDAGSGNLTLTLSTSMGGTLSATTGGGVAVGGSGTGTLTLTGTLADLNSYLDDPTKIQYLGAPDLSGNDADTITVDVRDNGNTGTGGGASINLGLVNVDITGANDTPVLDNSGAMTLSDVPQGTVNPLGDTVESIVASAGGDRITDVDSGALEGIAVIGVDDANGTWEFSTDGGSIWNSFVAGGVANGAIDDTTAVLLGASDRVRFVPNAGYSGPAGTITFRAWDQTAGFRGQTGVDVSFNGGTTPFSTVTETATLNVDAVGGVSTTTPGGQMTMEEVPLVFSTAGGNAITVSDGAAGDAVLRVDLSVSNGTLTLSGTAGITFVAGADGTGALTIVGTESDLNAALDGLTFTPTPDYDGPANLLVTTDLSAGLQGRYTFDNPVDPGNDDSPGGTNDGTVNGDPISTFDATRNSNVLVLNGDDSVQISGRFGTPTSVTLAAWVNMGPGTDQEVISLGNSVVLRLDDTNNGDGVTGFFYDGTGWKHTDSVSYVAGTGWHHVAYTLDGATNTQTIYIDGVPLGTTNYIGSVDWSLQPDTYLGANGSGTDYFLNGQLDDARIYNRSLTPGEVAALAADKTRDTDNVVISVNPVNDLPQLDLDADDSSGQTGADFATTFIEDGGPVAVADADAVLSDIDSPSLSSLTVTINNLLDGADEWLAADTSGTGITANYAGGVLTLSGTGTVAHYQQVLRTVTYDNTSQDPDTTARVITFVADDGTDASNVGTTTLTMVAQNDAPVISPPGGILPFNENSSPKRIDTTTSVSDADSTDFDGGTLTVDFSTGGTANDRVGIASSGQINVVGNDVFHGADLIGSFTGGGDGFTPLVVTLNANANASTVTDLVQNITYQNVSEDPDATSRNIRFVLTDGDGGTSDPKIVAVNVSAINDMPALDLDGDDSSGQAGADYVATFTEDGGSAFITDADASLADVDNTTLQSLTVTITNPLDGAAESLSADTTATGISASYDSVNGVLSLTGADTAANYQQVLRTITYDSTSQDPDTTARTITFVASDGTDDSNVATTTLTIAPQNDAPVVDDQSFGVMENSPNGTSVGTIAVSDLDSGDSHTFTVLGGTGATAFSVNPNTGEITVADSSQLDYETTTSLTLQVQVTDDGTPNLSDTATITINLTNEDEFDVGPITDSDASSDQVAEDAADGTAVGITALATDGDATDSVTYSLDDDAGGRFQIDSTTGVITVKDNSLLDYETQTSHNVTVRATSSDGSSRPQAFAINLTDDNTEFSIGPVTDNDAAANQVSENAANGTAVGITALATDGDATDTVTYSLDDDAGGRFQINATTGVITVADDTLLDYEAQTSYSVRVRATSTDGTSSTQSFTIDLTDENDTAPAIAPGQSFSVFEDAAIGTSVGTVAATDVDTVGGLQGWTIAGGNADGVLAIDPNTGEIFVADNTNLDFETTPVYTLTVTVSDGINTSAPETVFINTDNVNEAPAGSTPGPQVIAEDTPVVFSTAGGNAITVADVDAGSNPVIVTFSAANGTLTLGSTAGLTFGTGDGVDDPTMTFVGTIAEINNALDGLRFDPAPDYNGPASVQITVDDQGNVGWGGSKTDLDTIDITVTPANDAPIANDDAYEVLAGDTLNVEAVGVLAGDADVDGDGLTAVLVSGPTHGTLTLNPDGSFQYVPDVAFAGHDSFTYRAHDGTIGSNEATVVIAVAELPLLPPDDPPPVEGNDGNEENSDQEKDETNAKNGPKVFVPDPMIGSQTDDEPRPSEVPASGEMEVHEADPVVSHDVVARSTVEEVYPSTEATTSEASRRDSDAETRGQEGSDPSARETSDYGAATNEYGHFTRVSGLWEDLDQLDEEMKSDVQFRDIVIGSAAMGSVGLTVGFVMWMLRGGVLLSTLLAQLPAWRMVDPLVVLEHADRKGLRDAQEDAESLESIVEKGGIGG